MLKLRSAKAESLVRVLDLPITTVGRPVRDETKKTFAL
jgi:hypothetical protein